MKANFKCPSGVSKNDLFFAATHDYMTGVLNRYGFNLFISNLNFKTINDIVALSVIDIDNLSYINNTCGHDTGDTTIKKVADLLGEEFDVVCRWGGDEFVILDFDNCFDEKICQIQKKICGIFKHKKNDEKMVVKLSYGYDELKSSLNFVSDIYNVIKSADKKMYRYKMGQKS